MPQPPDSKIFSPLHSQMMNELGSSYLHSPTAFNNDNKGLQYQYGTNSMDIVDFLDSILVSSDEDLRISGVESESPKYLNVIERSLPKDSGSCSESELEVAQEQV